MHILCDILTYLQYLVVGKVLTRCKLHALYRCKLACTKDTHTSVTTAHGNYTTLFPYWAWEKLKAGLNKSSVRKFSNA